MFSLVTNIMVIDVEGVPLLNNVRLRKAVYRGLDFS